MSPPSDTGAGIRGSTGRSGGAAGGSAPVPLRGALDR